MIEVPDNVKIEVVTKGQGICFVCKQTFYMSKLFLTYPIGRYCKKCFNPKIHKNSTFGPKKNKGLTEYSKDSVYIKPKKWVGIKRK